MGSLSIDRPERTLIGDSLEISRMINGLWQRAGGHDLNTDMEEAVNVMEDTQVPKPCHLSGSLSNNVFRIQRGLDTFDMADHYGDAGQ